MRMISDIHPVKPALVPENIERNQVRPDYREDIGME
jgi:hypothetical protein